MWEKFINWDDVAIKVLRRHEENRIALANLREEYSSITDGLGATDYSQVRVEGSTDGDSSMVNRFLQKEALEAKIKELTQEDRQYNRAWDALDEDEKRILTEFFQQGRRCTEDAVDALCDYYDCDRRTVFRKRKASIERFKRLLVG